MRTAYNEYKLGADMRTVIKHGTERLFETLIDGIVAFTEYFVIRKRVTLSETTMFLYSLSWLAYFALADVPESAMVVRQSLWATIFLVTTVVHTVSFVFDDIIVRARTSVFIAIVWLCLTVLSFGAGSLTPAPPTLAVFTLVSLMIAVRLFRERRTQ